MNTFSALGLWALHFLMWYGVAALIGGASYLFFLTDIGPLSRFLFAAVFATFLLVCGLANFVALYALYVLPVPLIVVLLIGVPHTFIECSLARDTMPWRQIFLKTLATNGTALYGCLVLAGFFLVVLWQESVGPLSWNFGGMWGYITGTLITPFSISFFRWMLSHLKLRPGLDRHLTIDEGLEN